jgi:hypothetical protein
MIERIVSQRVPLQMVARLTRAYPIVTRACYASSRTNRVGVWVL